MVERGLSTKIVTGAILLAGLVPTLFPVRAAGRIGEAAVREGPHGGPCFTISPREERLGTPNFHAVSVTDGKRLMWKMATPKERSFPLGYGMCVPYGGRVAALPRTEAAELVPGRVYSLRIEARSTAPRAVPLAYEARFCLARRPDGSAAVHQILAGERGPACTQGRN